MNNVDMTMYPVKLDNCTYKKYCAYLKFHLIKYLRVSALCALAVALAGCSDEQKLPELAPEATILAFGDSLTAGKGVSVSNAYPAVLQKILSRNVVNSGISGETTSEGLSRLPGVLDKENPDLLLLLEGGNDILRNQDLAATKRNLSAMIQLAKQRDIPVVLIGVPKKSLLGKTAGFYFELAEEHEIPLQDTIIGKLLRDQSMKSDSVHFNTKGYAALAQALADLLREQGAIGQ